MRPRPISINIFGILNIGFGALALGSMAFAGVMRSMRGANATAQAISDNTWSRINTPISAVAGVALIVAGVGLLMLNNWARIVSIVYAVYDIIATILSVFFVVIPTLQAKMPAMPGASPELARIFLAVGMAIGLCFSLIYPVLLLVFMNRPAIVNACRPPDEPPPTPPSVPPPIPPS